MWILCVVLQVSALRYAGASRKTGRLLGEEVGFRIMPRRRLLAVVVVEMLRRRRRRDRRPRRDDGESRIELLQKAILP